VLSTAIAPSCVKRFFPYQEGTKKWLVEKMRIFIHDEGIILLDDALIILV
jgi:hypothetical protein